MEEMEMKLVSIIVVVFIQEEVLEVQHQLQLVVQETMHTIQKVEC